MLCDVVLLGVLVGDWTLFSPDPFPWKVGDFMCRNINKIDEFVAHFKKLNLTYAERLKGFNPNGIFGEHLLGVGFNTSFIHRHLTQDRDSVDNNHAFVDCDGETL